MTHILNSEEQYKRMTETPVPRLVLSLAIPTVIGMLITVAYNTSDTYFVSHINKSASAAVGVVYSIMAILQAFGYGLGVGAGSLISRRLGEKDALSASKYASCAFFTSVIVGAVIGITGLCVLKPFLGLLGCSETMLPYAVPYAKYILIGAPVSCSVFVLNNALRAEGESRLSVWGVGIGGVLNIFLDPILIFTLNMGCGGAALATVISQCVSFLILISYYLRKKTIVRINVKYLSRDVRDYTVIFATGFPTICRQGLGSVAAALLNIQAVVYGDAAVAAITIANKVYVLIRNIVIGIGQGFQPAAGFNYGAKRKDRAWKAFTFSVLLGSVFCVVSAVLTFLFPSELMRLFSDDAEVIAIGRQTLIFACAVMPLMAFSTYVNQLYQCLGFKAPATFLASCRQGVFFIPAVLTLPFLFGCAGVEACQPAADLMTFLISVPFIIRFYIKYIKQDKIPE